jgi:hypothetical protein
MQGTSVPTHTGGRTPRRQHQGVHLNNFYKGGYVRISIGEPPFMKLRTRSHLPTLATDISHLISIAAVTFVTGAILSKLVILVIGVSHLATIVRHIINQSFIFMSSSMSSSFDQIAICE